MKKALAFDDVLLVPQYSEIPSRGVVSLHSRLDKDTILTLPIISSPMDTITGPDMLVHMHKAGGLGVLHRYGDNKCPKPQVAWVEDLVQLGEDYCGGDLPITVAVSSHQSGEDYAMELVEAGATGICIDVAHGHHAMVERSLKTLKDVFGDDVHLMAGSVATSEGYLALSEWGADSVRVGVGGGSVCSTRLQTGHGVPTFQSVLDVCATKTHTKIIADGGIRYASDIVKSLAAGADFVMCGSMLAGTEPCPGKIIHTNRNKKYKVYRGMASYDAQMDWRGYASAPEGVETLVEYRGALEPILAEMKWHIQSGLSYSGARTIKELQERAQFIIQTSAGLAESRPHI